MQRRALFLVLALTVAACGEDDDAPAVTLKTITYFVAAEPVD